MHLLYCQYAFCFLQAWVIAGIFVLLAVPVSIYEVAMQLEYFSRPKLQIRVIRILWMVPIYAMDSWLALRFEVRRCLPEFSFMQSYVPLLTGE